MSVLERLQKTTIHDAPCTSEINLAPFRELMRKRLFEKVGLSVLAQMVQDLTTEKLREELRVSCTAIVHDSAFTELNSQQQEQLVRQVLDEICGLGSIQGLLDDPTITEVMINGCNSVFYERDGGLFESDIGFDSAEQIMILLDRILAPLGRRIDRASPLVNARLANGDRVHAVARPIALDGPIVTIRKFSSQILTLEMLVQEKEALPQWLAELLKMAVHARKNIAVVGATGSGKTTLLNALSVEISKSERIVTIEDSAELQFYHHPNLVRLETRDSSIEGIGEVTIRELVRASLRMRPDRIVVGEVRGEECIDMIQAMSTGHDGSLTTLHAGSPEEAILRLVMMSRFGLDLPTELIEEQIANALDLIVIVKRMQDGRRKVIELAEVFWDTATSACKTRPAVSYSNDTWHMEKIPDFVDSGLNSGYLTSEEVLQWKNSLHRDDFPSIE